MFKKNWKSRSAVSPVIATILMVAITVVLAAVLYVMVMGMGGDSGATPSVALSKRTGADAGTYEVYVLSVSGGEVAVKNAEIVVTGGTIAETDAWKLTGSGRTADDMLKAGDYFVVEPGETATKITVMIRDKATGNSMGTLDFNI